MSLCVSFCVSICVNVYVFIKVHMSVVKCVWVSVWTLLCLSVYKFVSESLCNLWVNVCLCVHFHLCV